MSVLIAHNLSAYLTSLLTFAPCVCTSFYLVTSCLHSCIARTTLLRVPTRRFSVRSWKAICQPQQDWLLITRALLSTTGMAFAERPLTLTDVWVLSRDSRSDLLTSQKLETEPPNCSGRLCFCLANKSEIALPSSPPLIGDIKLQTRSSLLNLIMPCKRQ